MKSGPECLPGHDFISSDDILVVPNFRTNEDLKNAICNRLNSKIMTKTVTERQPLPISKHPRLIVFRPSGRAGDEFQDNVTPHLTDPDRTYYLIIASTTNPMEMFNLKQVSVQRFQKQKTGLTITIGKLDENEFNSTALQGLARAICEEYSHYVEKQWTCPRKNSLPWLWLWQCRWLSLGTPLLWAAGGVECSSSVVRLLLLSVCFLCRQWVVLIRPHDAHFRLLPTVYFAIVNTFCHDNPLALRP
ncbi:uncharacterized protein LOC124258565 isoform X2 [Haliotis rubra]|uniref:uncharacterized protein LOC124258565 isoform X2 n=1 Tax=Haliotis rubra TaxID=36100 RepID=UPI001EE6002F|nr:uncharacterized protein LOC124258565 isoform X2 [Haliotis rubra]